VVRKLAAVSSGGNEQLRRRIELGIALAAPVLDLMLAVGDRASRLLNRGEPDPLPARIRLDGERAPRSLPPRTNRS
jgi:hypothetical protein